MSKLLRSATLSGLVPLCQELQLDAGALLTSVGITRQALDQPDLRISTQAVAQLLERCAQLSGTDDFGLRLAETREVSNLGPLGLLLCQEPTFRRALESMARYLRMHNEALDMRFERFDKLEILSMNVVLDKPVPLAQGVDLAVGGLYKILCSVLGAQWRPQRACFQRKPPASLAVYRRVFGPCALEFNASFNGFVFWAEDLEKTIPSANANFSRYAHAFLSSLDTGQGEGDFLTQVDKLVRSLLPFGACTIEKIALHLGMDRRTIHRKLLQQGGTTFSALLLKIRCETVMPLLQDSSKPMTEIASLLGFSAASSFTTWFREHYGCSPTDWRAAHRSQPGA